MPPGYINWPKVTPPKYATDSMIGTAPRRHILFPLGAVKRRSIQAASRADARVARRTAQLANVSSLLWHAYSALPAPSSSVNWTGFYIRDDKFPTLASSQESIVRTTTTTVSTTYSDPREQKLLLGPFHGKPACQLIFFGKGVCGTAAMKKETVMVDDVLQFPGHIACDADSRSEVVVPIIVGDETVAILDIDCTETAGFDDVDKKYLEELAVILAEGCDW
ncbi:GAF domain nucleotide-binding protein [Aspergillus sclerotialis]|uniref:GAF domain nucleotide-binding protein n=1 Tax=Aspergillus sclerotialis TaxID=2070753 RepID=A0A3A2ZVQ2_9EURO|nr:GAF domain nucleotide-binding protein [Aspergillus sclerotialis]